MAKLPTGARYLVTIADAGRAFNCGTSESILAGMQRAGAASIKVGCRNGGCGVCRIQVVDGNFSSGLMSAGEVSVEDRAQGIVLACRTFPLSDLFCRPLGKRPALPAREGHE